MSSANPINQIYQRFLAAAHGQEIAELEMTSPIFDVDEPVSGPTNHYIILSTPRSGSYWLCRRLWEAGLGLPFEYLNRLHMQHFAKRWKAELEHFSQLNNHSRSWKSHMRHLGARLLQLAPAKKRTNLSFYLEAIEKKRSKNGWTGIKLQPIHIQELGIDFEKTFHSWSLIPLLRRNQRRQLASYLFARVSGAYDLGIITSGTGDSLSRLNDQDLISHMARLLANQNKTILEIAGSRNLKPLWMEDLLKLDSNSLQMSISPYLPEMKQDEHIFATFARRQDPFANAKQVTIEEISRSIPASIVTMLEQSLTPIGQAA